MSVPPPAAIAALGLLACGNLAVPDEPVPAIDPTPRGLLTGTAAHQPAYGAYGRPNLCVTADRVLIARVAAEEARLVDDRALWPSQMIVTRSTLRVETTIFGDVNVGESVYVDELGGEYGDLGMIVEGRIGLYLGMRYVVFLRRADDDAYANYDFDLIARYSVPRLDSDPPLPSTADLRAVVVATCEANPDGLYFHQAIGPLCIPRDVRERNPTTSFKWELFGR